MSRRHHGFLFRICGLVLLLLAFAPVTAPFSTLDLVDFFRDVTPADAGTIGHAKIGADKKLSSVPGAVMALALSCPLAARVRAVAVRPVDSREPAVVPLRV